MKGKRFPSAPPGQPREGGASGRECSPALSVSRALKQVPDALTPRETILAGANVLLSSDVARVTPCLQSFLPQATFMSSNSLATSRSFATRDNIYFFLSVSSYLLEAKY